MLKFGSLAQIIRRFIYAKWITKENSASWSNLAKTLSDQIQIWQSLHCELSPNELQIGGLAQMYPKPSHVNFQDHLNPFDAPNIYQTPFAKNLLIDN